MGTFVYTVPTGTVLEPEDECEEEGGSCIEGVPTGTVRRMQRGTATFVPQDTDLLRGLVLMGHMHILIAPCQPTAGSVITRRRDTIPHHSYRVYLRVVCCIALVAVDSQTATY